jgi:hypothetical protein
MAQPPPPWDTIPNNRPPAGYRPRLQQPYGRPPYTRLPPTPPKKRLPVIAWIGIGVGGVLLIAVLANTGTTGSTDATMTTSPLRTSTARVVTATPTRTTSGTGASSTRAATPTVAPTPLPTNAVAIQVVTVKDDPVNVRRFADASAPVIGTLAARTEVPVVGADVTGSDGTTRWVHVRIGEQDGYVRSDLVSAHHVPSRVNPTAAPAG